MPFSDGDVVLSLRIGSVIRCERDSYRLVRLVSSGGMGVVWEGESAKSRRPVVLKTPLLNGENDHVKIERLLYETSILHSINDEQTAISDTADTTLRTHVVHYVDQLNDARHPLLVLEFVNGPVMSDACKGKPPAESLAVRYTTSLLEVVIALHSRGVVHRDISPSNIILHPTRGIVLIDFGASMLVSKGNPRTGRVVFKRGFSAPELLDGRYDARSDIFSVAATLLFLLTGKNPSDYLKPQLSLPPDLASPLSRILRKAMAEQPEHRFENANDMLDAMKRSTSIGKAMNVPSITLHGTTYELRRRIIDLGRDHECNASCAHRTKGSMQIRIYDPQKYIEKHHIRIRTHPTGACFIKDLGTANRTAIKRVSGSREFRVLSPLEEEELQNGDIVALAYSQTRGPYLTFVFNSTRESLRHTS